jgi:hypothetical protein
LTPEEDSDFASEMTLGKTYFSRSIEIEVDRITVQSDIRDLDPTDDDLLAGTISLWANYITVDAGTVIDSPKIVMWANHSLTISNGTELNSLV